VRLGQVRVVHFTAVLTAILQELHRTPQEEFGASSAVVNKHQLACALKTVVGREHLLPLTHHT
jgi:hypothetical protein